MKKAFFPFVKQSRVRRWSIPWWIFIWILSQVYGHLELSVGAKIACELIPFLPVAILISWVGLYRKYLLENESGPKL